MQVNYTIKDYQFKEMSKGKGIVRWFLLDDQGKERVIGAMAKIGLTNNITSIKPIHAREQPLIDVLRKAQVDERIVVDFSDYNNKHPRGSMRNQKITAQTKKIADDYEDSLINDFESLKDHKMRIVKLIALSCLVLTAFLFAKDSFF